MEYYQFNEMELAIFILSLFKTNMTTPTNKSSFKSDLELLGFAVKRLVNTNYTYPFNKGAKKVEYLEKLNKFFQNQTNFSFITHNLRDINTQIESLKSFISDFKFNSNQSGCFKTDTSNSPHNQFSPINEIKKPIPGYQLRSLSSDFDLPLNNKQAYVGKLERKASKSSNSSIKAKSISKLKDQKFNDNVNIMISNFHYTNGNPYDKPDDFIKKNNNIDLSTIASKKTQLSRSKSSSRSLNEAPFQKSSNNNLDLLTYSSTFNIKDPALNFPEFNQPYDFNTSSLAFVPCRQDSNLSRNSLFNYHLPMKSTSQVTFSNLQGKEENNEKINEENNDININSRRSNSSLSSSINN